MSKQQITENKSSRNINRQFSTNSLKKSQVSVKSPQNNILETLKQDFKQPENNPYYLKNENLDKFENFDGKFLRENRAELVTEEENYDLENFTVSSVFQNPPIEFNSSRELVYFLENTVIRAVDQPKLREKYLELIGQPRTSKMIQLCFWFILLTKFPGCLDVDDPEGFMAEIRRKMQKKYVKVYTQIQQPKEELINLFIYTLGWMSHYLFYKYFAKQRFFFDLRFILDCYHILVFEFNGMYVSDFYVRLNLERIFTVKFLCYETLGKPKKKPVATRPEKFLGNFKFNDTEDAGIQSLNLAQILNDKFKPKKQLNNNKKNNSDFIEKQRQNLIEKTSLQVQLDRTLERQKKLYESIQGIPESQVNISIQNQEGYQDENNEINQGQENSQNIEAANENQENNMKNTNQSIGDDLNININNSKSFDQQSNQQLSQNKQKHKTQQKVQQKSQYQINQSKILNSTVTNQSLQPGQQNNQQQQQFLGNLKMNCMQVSPTVGNILSYDNMSLPFMKSKLIRHVFDTISQSNTNLLGKLKQFNSISHNQREVKEKSEVKLSILDNYDLRSPNKEFYTKHPQLDHLFKDMLDMNFVLNEHGEKMIKLPSSQEVMKNYISFRKQKEIEAHLEKTRILQQKQKEQKEMEENQKRELIRNLKQKKVRLNNNNINSSNSKHYFTASQQNNNLSRGNTPTQSQFNLISALDEKLQDNYLGSSKIQNLSLSQLQKLQQLQNNQQQQQSQVKFPDISNMAQNQEQSKYCKSNNNYNAKSSLAMNSMQKKGLRNLQTNQSLKMDMQQSQVINIPASKFQQQSNQKSQYFMEYSQNNSLLKKSQNPSMNGSEMNFMSKKKLYLDDEEDEIDESDRKIREQIVTNIIEPLKKNDFEEYSMMLKPSKNIGCNNDFVYKDKRSKHKEKYAKLNDFGNTDHNIDKLIRGIIQQKQSGNQKLKKNKKY